MLATPGMWLCWVVVGGGGTASCKQNWTAVLCCRTFEAMRDKLLMAITSAPTFDLS
jgi:hypothetical protein